MTAWRERLRQEFEQHHLLAQQGNKEAQYWTGYSYFRGRGVERDMYQAFRWYQRAANQQSGKAMYQMGTCHFWGWGVAPNKAIGRKTWAASIPLLFIEAEKCDDLEAMCVLGSSAFFYGHEGLARDRKRGFEFVLRAAEAGHARSLTWLGSRHEFGNPGSSADQAAAFALYQRAAINGDQEGQENVARCYGDGIGTTRDYVKALDWYQQAMDTGHDIIASSGRKRLLQDIRRRQSTLQAQVQTSFQTDQDAQEEAMSSLSSSSSSLPSACLSKWAHGLEVLVAQRNQPAGFSPAFHVLTQLVPPTGAFQQTAEQPSPDTKPRGKGVKRSFCHT